MSEENEKSILIDDNNKIEQKKQIIIEQFVKYFGEKYRPRIEEKLNNTTIIMAPRNLERDFDIYPDIAKDEYQKNNPKAYEELLNNYEAMKSYKKPFIEEREKILSNHFEKYSTQPYNSKLGKEYLKFLEMKRENFLDPDFMNDYRKEKIIEFAKKTGFNLGNDFSSYENNEKFMSFLCDENIHNEIKNIMEKESISFMKTPYYDAIIDKIVRLNMNDNNALYVMNSIGNFMDNSKGTLAFQYSYLDTKDKQFKSIVVTPLSFELSDDTLVHELLHSLGADLIYNDNGIEQLKEGLNLFTKDEGYRDRDERFLNEAVVDYTATNIVQQMRSQRIKLYPHMLRESGYTSMIKMIEPILNDHRDLFEMSFLCADPNLVDNNLYPWASAFLANIATRAHNINIYDYNNWKRKKTFGIKPKTTGELNVQELMKDAASLRQQFNDSRNKDNIIVNEPKKDLEMDFGPKINI